MWSSTALATALLCAQAAVGYGNVSAHAVGTSSVNIHAYRKVRGMTAHSHSRGAAVPLTSSFSFDGIRAWHPSLSGYLHNFPERYARGQFQIATPNNFRFPGDAVVEYDCPPAAARVGPCDVVVFLYECYPCVSVVSGMPAHLLANGYERTRCAPVFSVRPGGYRHRMTAFIKTIPAGAHETITMPGTGPVEFVAFGLSNGRARDCSTYSSQDSCEGVDGHCVWNPLRAPRCKLASCVQSGPGGGCNLLRCVHHELQQLR